MRLLNFIAEWSEIPISKLLSFQNGINASSDKYGKGVKYISVTDILNNSFITYECIKGLVDIDQKTLNNYSVTYGDILFQRSSEVPEDIGQSNVYLDNDNIATFGGFVIRGKKIGNYNPLFFNYMLKSPNARRKIIRLGAGAQHYNIGQENLRSLNFFFPIEQEQERIGELFRILDERIATQNKIINNLESQKNYIINRLIENENNVFSISELMYIGRGRVISNNELNKIENGKYPVYSSQTSNKGIMGYLNTFDFDGEYITWTTDGANAGTVYYRNGKFNCTNVCGTLKRKRDNVDLFYVAQILPLFTKKYVSTNLANPKLMNNVMGSIKIPLPSINIQKQHSSIIKKIKEKIDIETQILDNLKLQKNYLLNNLFI